MLGFFDSGLGGLTVLRQVRAALPALDLVYLADQANVPYGDRAPEELQRLLAHNVRFLGEAGVAAIVMACNTTCAIGGAYGWPPSTVPILDLIEVAAIAVRDCGAQRVGVVATAATVRSGAYTSAISRLAGHVKVTEAAAPALVPLVEAGELESERTRAAVAAACGPLAGNIDAIVYGCSHYPLLDAHFAAVLGESVQRIDPGEAQAVRAAAFAREHRLSGTGQVRYFTTGDVEPFAEAATEIVGEIPNATFASFAMSW